MENHYPTSQMTVNFAKLPELLRRKTRPPIDGPAPLLYRDDGEVLGCVLRPEATPRSTPALDARDALCRLGAHPTVAAARRAVERAIGAEEGELRPFERVTRPPGPPG